jgi:glycosyltransferase involved in cell wall biosynthesis
MGGAPAIANEGRRHLKVLHIITGLNTGGAEMMLFKLLATLRHREGLEMEVISLRKPGRIGAMISELGIRVSSPKMNGGILSLSRLPQLVSMVRAARTDVVQTWMSHANVLGGIAARAAGVSPIVWGLRQSQLTPGMGKRSTEAVIRLGGFLSHRIPVRIVCVSEAARLAHSMIGYDDQRCVVIPNGFDLDLFRPDPDARAALRAELALDAETAVVGLIARTDPYKDHATFITAAARVRLSYPNTVFVLAGEGADESNLRLAKMIRDSGLESAMRLLGARSDVARITASLDVAVSSSACGEAFSNTLGEALCSGVPAAATDVGDSALIIGDTGLIVAPGDPVALAGAINELIALGPEGRVRLGAAGRARMARDYGLAAVAARYEALYHGIVWPPGQGGS